MKRHIDTTIWKLYTADTNSDALSAMVSEYFPNFASFHGNSYWHGSSELTVCFEIVDDVQDGTIRAKLEAIICRLTGPGKDFVKGHGHIIWNQTEVLVTETKIKAHFLKHGETI